MPRFNSRHVQPALPVLRSLRAPGSSEATVAIRTGRQSIAALVGLIALLGVAACGAGRQSPDVDNGRRLYVANGCRVCHGEEGRGDGPTGRTLDPPPRDFRDLASYQQGSSIEAIASTIGNGIRKRNSMMQAYAHISERDRLLIATYVKQLQESN